MNAAASTPQFSLEYDTFGRLVLIDAEGRRHDDVDPVRAFPFTDPRRWISLCSSDGREILSVGSLDDLDPATRNVLEVELKRRVFQPIIQKVVRVTIDAEPVEWTVETDRGRTKFLVEGSDAVRRIDDDRCLIVDMHGVHYLIVDVKQLDAASRRRLEQYL